MIFDKRNLVYGDSSFIYHLLKAPYTIIALGDYHDGYLFKSLDLLLFSKEIFFVPAYNKRQFARAVKEAMDLELPTLILNIHRLFRVSDFPFLNNAVHKLLNSFEQTVFLTTKPIDSKKYPPSPYAPHYIRHLCDVVVFSKRTKIGFSLHLIKHPSLPYRKFYIGDRLGKELSIYSQLD